MMTDASCLPRLGVKGPQAETWLRGQGVRVPEGVNSWHRTDEGVLVARLARTEFLLEDKLAGAAVQRLRDALAPAPGIYPVLRQDAALALAGQRLNDLLVQTCNVSFKSYAPGEGAVVMTSMVGVSVLVLWDQVHTGPLFRLWCDGTFGPYLWETLLGIARADGGGAVGLRKLFPEAS
jgi:sarcosine oxidase subunit gamma